MSANTLFWLSFTILCICIQGFYSMLEMAIVSLNRVKLEFLIYKKNRKAIWIKRLLAKPTRLFSSFMLGVNIALQFGSQGSRELYQALHLNPDFAPITQIIAVVIVGELAPLFAARRYADSIALFGIDIIYWTSVIFAPVIWLIEKIMFLITKALKMSDKTPYFINRDEIQKNLEDPTDSDEFNLVVSHIFDFHQKKASQIMTPLSDIQSFNGKMTFEELKSKYVHYGHPFFLVYYKNPKKISALVTLKELTAIERNKPLKDLASPPWFIAENDSLTKILKQFRNNQKTVAVVLNDEGETTGIITLDALLEEIFGDIEFDKEEATTQLIEREIDPQMTVEQFTQAFGISLKHPPTVSIAQLIEQELQRKAEVDDVINIEKVEFHVLETSTFGIKRISAKKSL